MNQVNPHNKIMAYKTIGIIVNPAAGMGKESNRETFIKLVSKLASYKLLIASGSMGEEYLFTLSSNQKVIGEQSYLDRRDTIRVAHEMTGAGADLLIGIGGDGTLADISYAIYQAKKCIPVIGIGVGSANVGALIRYRAAEIDRFSLDSLKEEDLNCILAFYQDKLVGLGFNDCVIGTTVVGTLNGNRTDLDAVKYMQGHKVPAQSQPIGTPETSVLKNDRVIIKGQQQKVGQIIVSPLDDRYLGKAVSGLLCWSPFLYMGAALIVSPVPLVQVNLNREVLCEIEPLNLSQFLFDEEDRIELRGIRSGAVLCLDGNPHVVLKQEDMIGIRFKKNAVKTLR
jgi:NAD kinase